MKRVTPSLPAGFRDYPPSEMAARTAMLQTIRSAFERFGFDPLETPGVERLSVLTGGEENFRMNLFEARITRSKITTDQDQMMGLRFDLTVPLARFIAANPELPKPFRRYQVGSVWRGEKPQAGRFREFLQFDADIVGSDSPLADAEIIALMVTTMRELVGERFTVRFNSRHILNGLSGYAGFDPSLNQEVLRIIDKLPKIGVDAVLRELQKAPGTQEQDEGAEFRESESGLGLSATTVERIGAFIALKGSTDELMDASSSLFRGVPVAERGIEEVRTIVRALRAMGIPERHWRLDLSVARGLAYYTGPVFETFLDDLPAIGSVFSGGRYDDLVNRFMEGNFPATGASVGVDRLFAALKELGKVEFHPTLTQVLVTVMDDDALDDYLAMVGELRAADIRTQVWMGQKSFKEQLSFAAKQEIPFVVIAGTNERRDGTVTVKRMRERQQDVVPRSDLVATIRLLMARSFPGAW